MESQEVSSLPLATRNYNQLTLLTPGAVIQNAFIKCQVFAKAHGRDFALVDVSQPIEAGSRVRLVAEPAVNGHFEIAGAEGKRLFDKRVLANTQYTIDLRKGETLLHIVFNPQAPSIPANAAGRTSETRPDARNDATLEKRTSNPAAPVVFDIHLSYR